MRKLAVLLFCLMSGVAMAADVSEIVKLKQTGVGDEVILAYIDRVEGTFNLSADYIKTLKEVGLSDDVITAMMKHGVKLTADDQPDVIRQPKEVTISTFYEALTPYGKWVQDPDLGWVFQPNEVVTDVEWRPYCHGGHWVYTDCGWYWSSNYEWGWACFHYGRWARHNTLTWVWVPDCTWGPAWVSWRECDTHFGWAPLPPACAFEAGVGFSFHSKHVDFGFEFGLGIDDYFFCPCGALLEVNLWHHRCRHEDCVKIYNTCHIHNTIVVRNKTIIHEGCGHELVEKRVGHRVEEVRVHSAPREAGRVIHGDRETKNGIVAYRPEVKRETPVAPNVVAERHEERKQQFEQRREQAKHEQEQRKEEARQHREELQQQHQAQREQHQEHHSAPPVQHHEAPPVHHESPPVHHESAPPAHHK